MRKRRAGLALITVLSIIAVVFTVQIALTKTLAQSRHRISVHKLKQTAKAMAISGLDYGAGRLKREGWTPTKTWTSPAFDGAYFTLSSVPDDAGWKLVSVGVAGNQKVTLERCVP